MVTKTPKKRAATKPPSAPQKTRKELTAILQTSRQSLTAEICLVPGCQGVVAARGMCLQCYNTAKRNIQRSKATWEEFIAAGLTREANGKSSLVMDALRNYREKIGSKKQPGKRRAAASAN